MYTRTKLLLGEEEFNKLTKKHVMVIGNGGVGSHAAIALARMGIGKLTLMDFDVINITNLNRHAQATKSNVGKSKTLELKAMIEDFSETKVQAIVEKFTAETRGILKEVHPDFVIDAIDIVTHKLELIKTCQELGIPFITALGAGNRQDPRKLDITKLSKTQGDPLAKVMRHEVRKRKMKDFPVVASTELPSKIVASSEEKGRHSPASAYFVPSYSGHLLAYWVIEEIKKERDTDEHTNCE